MIATIINKTENISINNLHVLIVFLGLLIAAQIQYIQHGWINADSVLYFEGARLIALGEWKAAYDVFAWPFYALCIAGVHLATSLSIHVSAQVLNVVFFGIATASFIQIIRLAGGTRKVMLAGAIILFSSLYLAGDVLGMLMRDEGFWAFYLTSLVFFIRFYRSNNYYDAFIWQLSMMIAFFFRVEAVSYTIFLPIILLFIKDQTFKQKLYKFLKCNWLIIGLMISLFITIAASNNLSMQNFGRLKEVFTLHFYNELTSQLLEKSAIMSKDVLGKFLEEFAVQGILMTFLYVMVAKTISTTGVVHIGLATLGLKNHSTLLKPDAARILKAVAAISLLNMALIITKVFVLSGRYVIGLVWVLFIFGAFYLADCFKYLQSTKRDKSYKKLAIIAIIIFMLLSIVKNSLPKSDGYIYMQDAAAWIKQNNPNHLPVFYDDTRMRYYTNEPFIGTWGDNWLVLTNAIKDKTIHNYEYLVISQSKKHTERESVIVNELKNYQEVQRFSPKKATKSIVIYRKKPR